MSHSNQATNIKRGVEAIICQIARIADDLEGSTTEDPAKLAAAVQMSVRALRGENAGLHRVIQRAPSPTSETQMPPGNTLYASAAQIGELAAMMAARLDGVWKDGLDAQLNKSQDALTFCKGINREIVAIKSAATQIVVNVMSSGDDPGIAAETQEGGAA